MRYEQKKVGHIAISFLIGNSKPFTSRKLQQSQNHFQMEINIYFNIYFWVREADIHTQMKNRERGF